MIHPFWGLFFHSNCFHPNGFVSAESAQHTIIVCHIFAKEHANYNVIKLYRYTAMYWDAGIYKWNQKPVTHCVMSFWCYIWTSIRHAVFGQNICSLNHFPLHMTRQSWLQTMLMTYHETVRGRGRSCFNKHSTKYSTYLPFIDTKR